MQALQQLSAQDFTLSIQTDTLPMDAGLIASSTLRRLNAGETLYYERDMAPTCFQVVSGVMKEYNMLEDGKRQVLDFYSVGEVFGLSESRNHLHTAEAVTDCVIRSFPRDAYLSAIAASPMLSERFITSLMGRLHRSRERLVMLGRMSATERMALFLLRLSEDQDRTGDVRFLMSRQDIGDHLGLTTETVCRVLTDLKKRGIIVCPTARLFSIADMDALTALAHGNAGSAH